MGIKYFAVWLLIFGTLAVCGWAHENQEIEFEVSIENDQDAAKASSFTASSVKNDGTRYGRTKRAPLEPNRNHYGGKELSKGGRNVEEERRAAAIRQAQQERERRQREDRERMRARAERERRDREHLEAEAERARQRLRQTGGSFAPWMSKRGRQ